MEVVDAGAASGDDRGISVDEESSYCSIASLYRDIIVVVCRSAPAQDTSLYRLPKPCMMRCDGPQRPLCGHGGMNKVWLCAVKVVWPPNSYILLSPRRPSLCIYI